MAVEVGGYALVEGKEALAEGWGCGGAVEAAGAGGTGCVEAALGAGVTLT